MTSPRSTIQGPSPGRRDHCEDILRSLPEWFGVESALLQYLGDATGLPTFTASIDGQAIGFLCIKRHTPASAEVHLIAVHRLHHRRGLGHQLLTAAEVWLRQQNTRLLHVKTLSTNHPDPHYAVTRRFYESQGFEPLAELPELWGKDQPCLMMLKTLCFR